MSYRIEQKVGKHVYLYEVESYWDKEKKQPRQIRTFLGKKDPATGELLLPVHQGYRCWEYGATYFLTELARRLSLDRLLRQHFPHLWQELLTCVFFELCEQKPLYLCQPWAECSYTIAEHDLSSQRVSELLGDLGRQEEARFAFLKSWAAEHAANETVVFDITSFSSYAKHLDLLEWGYNRDRERLPQLNFGLLYGEPSGLPLYYTRYPGSIKDVTTLANMVAYLEWLHLSDSLFVLDRGFYSAYNLKKMDTAGMRFIIPLPYTSNQAAALIGKHSRSLAHSSNAFRLNAQILYGVSEQMDIGAKSYSAHLYLDEKRRVEERERWLAAVLELEQKVAEPGLCQHQKVLEGYLSDTVTGWKNLFTIVQHNGCYAIRRKDQPIEQQLEKMGTMILLSNTGLDGKEVLRLYRRKDGIEKFFDTMKHDLERKRLRIHSQQTLDGRLFLDFLALILFAQIRSVMRQEGIGKDLTVQELMYELKKIKLIGLGAKKTIVTEVSKKQRELFQRFNIPLPTRP